MQTHETPSPNETSPLPDDAIGATPAAQIVRCHVSTIHRWVLAGVIPGWRRGRGKRRRLYVSMADVAAQVEQAVPAAGPAPEPTRDRQRRRRRTREILRKFNLEKYVAKTAR